jgi:hypothetical protein
MKGRMRAAVPHSIPARAGGWVSAVLVLAVLGTACGLRVNPAERISQDFLGAVVATDTAAVPPVGDGSFVHGGIAEIKGPPRARGGLAPGGVYLGTERLEVRLPDLGAGSVPVTYPQWAAMFLPRLGAPVCGNNMVAVVAWQAQEGTRAAWNPLATTRGMPGSTRFNSHGVQNYRSVEEGLQATVLTLRDGWTIYGYGPIVANLQRCAPPQATAEAIRASRWCSNCAGGLYLTALISAVIADFNRAFAPRSRGR